MSKNAGDRSRTQPMTRRKRILFVIGMMACLGVAVLVGSEILVRVVAPQSPVPKWNTASKEYGIDLKKNFYQHYAFPPYGFAMDVKTNSIGLRDDDNVVAVSTQPSKFKPVRFNIAELIGRFAWDDWLNFVNSDWVRDMVYVSAGDWGNYVKAAMLRLQHRYQDVRVRGINIALAGNVPIAAGLSSSSTIVVATLQAAIAYRLGEPELAPDEADCAVIERREGSVGQHGMVMEVGVELGAEPLGEEIAPVLGLVAGPANLIHRVPFTK